MRQILNANRRWLIWNSAMVAVLIAAPFGVVPHWLIYLAIGCLLYHVVKIIRKFAD